MALPGLAVAQTVAVPDVIGDTQANATTAITGAGLAVGAVTTVVNPFGLNNPGGVISDSNQNLYIADAGNNVIKEWVAATGQLMILPIAGLNRPSAVGIDKSGNLYIADTGNNAIKEWTTTSQLITLVSTGLNAPQGVVVERELGGVVHIDGVAFTGQSSNGDVYISDTGNNLIKVWHPSSQTVDTLTWATGLNHPTGIGFGMLSGIVFVADTGNNLVKALRLSAQTVLSVTCGSNPCQFNAPVAVVASSYVDNAYPGATDNGNRGVYTLDSVPVTFIPYDDLYIVDASNTPWWYDSVAQTLNLLQYTPLGSGVSGGPTFTVNQPAGVASDGADNVWVSNNTGLVRLTTGLCGWARRATLLTSCNPTYTMKKISLFQAGSPGTVDATNPALGTSVTHGSTVNLTLDAGLYGLSTNSVLVGSAGGNASVFLTVRPNWVGTAWAATANASFLHVATSGSASSAIAFSIDAFPGTGTRTGTLTIAGLTFTVTQTGADYQPAYPSALTSFLSGIGTAGGIAVDGSGNLYITVPVANVVYEWSAATQQLAKLISTGLTSPTGIAVDGSGNLYIAQSGELTMWTAGTQQLSNLAALASISGVAVDAAGNVYFANNTTLQKWTPGATPAVSTLTTALTAVSPTLAVDAAGNVYITTGTDNTVQKWNATAGVTTPLSGSTRTNGIAADQITGDVYIGSGLGIQKWTPPASTATPLVSGASGGARSLALDPSGNLYLAIAGGTPAILKLPRAYVSSAGMSEPYTAGSDSLPPVIPTTTDLTGTNAPVSDQSWLTVGNVGSGVVGFSFTANTTGAVRTGNITILGISYAINQQGQVAVPNVVGETQAQATTDITGAGLVVGNVTTASSSTVASGNVISSNPSAGTQVNPGSSVDLVISSGPALVAVPNVVGETQAQATTDITGAGLTIGTVTTASSSTVAAGSVISTSPTAATQVNPGSAVNLVVSTGPAAIPPTVVAYNVICGTGCVYNMIGTNRVHLPWQVTGIQIVFSQPITSANINSLTGVTATGFSGLGTKTLTWTFAGVTNSHGSLTTALAGTGPNAIQSVGGALTGSNTGAALKILEADFNDDGVVNASDATLINNARSAPYNIFADANGDGVVTIADVTVERTQNGQTNP